MEDIYKPKFSLNQTFAALKHRNFRLFWTGQAISVIGTWMQSVTQAWLVLELTKSAFWLGVIGALQSLPALLFSLHAGTIIDRFPKQKMLLFTQISLATLALILAIDTHLQTVALWHVLIIATLMGITGTFDIPTRQSFMIEMVGKEDLMNAIILNSSIFNAARIIGPAIAGFIIAQFGMNLCFYLNAISFVPVIIGITMIRPVVQHTTTAIQRKQSSVWLEIKEGLHYVAKTPIVMAPLLLLGIINLFALNYNVIIPLYARNVLKIGAQGYGFLMAATGVGAVIGTIILATFNKTPKAKTLAIAAAALCIFELSVMPVKNYLLAYFLLSLVGFSMIAFTTTNNSLIQVQTPDNLRGRVMSLYNLAFSGLSPFGSLLSGSVANLWGAPAALGLGAVICLVFTIILVLRYQVIFKTNIT